MSKPTLKKLDAHVEEVDQINIEEVDVNAFYLCFYEKQKLDRRPPSCYSPGHARETLREASSPPAVE